MKKKKGNRDANDIVRGDETRSSCKTIASEGHC